MGTAGSNVVGVDWRVPLDEARPARRQRDAPCREISTPRCAWRRGPSSRLASRAVLADAADGTGTGHVFNLGHGVLPETDPAILAAVVELVHAETALHDLRRPGDGPWHAVEHRGDRHLLHAHSPRTPSRACAVGRARRPLPRHWWRVAAGASAPRRRSTRCVAALEARAPGHFVVAFGAKHTDPLIEEAAAEAGLRGPRAGRRHRPHAPRLVDGFAGVPRPGRGRAAVRRVSCRFLPGTANLRSSPSSPHASGPPWRRWRVAPV